jgi:DNA-binding CsgD family transcriptional regulator
LKAFSTGVPLANQRSRNEIALMKNLDTADRSYTQHELCSLERKCLSLVATGHKAEEIAPLVGITAHEARVLLYCAQRKLGAENTMQAVAKYLADEMTGTIES